MVAFSRAKVRFLSGFGRLQCWSSNGVLAFYSGTVLLQWDLVFPGFLFKIFLRPSAAADFSVKSGVWKLGALP